MTTQAGPRRYVTTEPPPGVEPEVCEHCGGDIIQHGDRWHALEARWPNLAHCHYSPIDGKSVGHHPERTPS